MIGGPHLHKMSPPVSPYTKVNPKRVEKQMSREVEGDLQYYDNDSDHNENHL